MDEQESQLARIREAHDRDETARRERRRGGNRERERDNKDREREKKVEKDKDSEWQSTSTKDGKPAKKATFAANPVDSNPSKGNNKKPFSQFKPDSIVTEKKRTGGFRY